MREAIVKALKITGLSSEEREQFLETPRERERGDYAFPCFVLASRLKKNPVEIAKELAKQIKLPKEFDKVEAVGPYLNFFVNRYFLAEQTVRTILKQKDKYGAIKPLRKETLVVELSSPNVAKPFGIGHLRSTIIGNALAEIYRFLGHKVVTLNYLGDWGTPFGKIIAGYKAFGDEKALKLDPIGHLFDIYVKVTKDERFEAEGREWFRKLEDGDKEAMRFWKRFRDLSVKEFSKIYSLLGVNFDVLSGESHYTNKMGPVLDELKSKGLLVESEGALVVNLEEYGLGVCLIKKSDGATLYATRDLAAAIDRQKKYRATGLIYEVGSEQKLYFKQLFKILELMGYKWASKCVHVDHGLYLDSDGKKFSTRKGKTIFMESVLDETIELAKKEIMKRAQVSAKECEKRALAIARAAIFYGDLKNYRGHDMVFDIDRFVSFEGDTGPYLLYSYARARSILRKAGKNKDSKEGDITDKEGALVGELARFPDVVLRAAEQYAPNLIAHYAYTLSQTFNEFYHTNKVIGSEEEVFRLQLVHAFSQVLKNALHLLGISVLDEM